MIAVHIKHGIGPLSAFCGVASAGCAAGCGIVSNCVEKTIQNICRLGGNAMNETDEEIIRIMTHRD